MRLRLKKFLLEILKVSAISNALISSPTDKTKQVSREYSTVIILTGKSGN